MSVYLKNWQIIASEILVLLRFTFSFMASSIFAQKKNKQNKKRKTQKISKKRKEKETKREKMETRFSANGPRIFFKHLNYVVLSRYFDAKIPCSLCISCHCSLMLKILH